MEPGKRQLSIEYVPLTTVKRWPRNPKEHDLGQIHQSMARFGFVNPLTVNEATGELLAGHGRLDTLEQRHAAGEPPPDGIQANNGHWMIPVVRGITLATEEAAAYTIADNRLVELGGWNDTDLAAILQDMNNLDGIGFDQDDLDEILKGLNPPEPVEDPGPQIDRADELREKWGVESGQVWEIGKHRLMCGDATSAEDVAETLNGASPPLMVTDPPYGINYDPAWRKEAGFTASRVGAVTNDDRSDWREAYCLHKGAVAYVWHDARMPDVSKDGLEAAGFEVRTQIVWAKSHFAISRGHYNGQHEPCWYAVRKGAVASWVGDHSQSTLWAINHDHNIEGGHSTQKPLECMARPIRNHEGDVYDPFLGSGTTMVAAEQLGRICYGMEIEPKYVAVSLQRMAGMGLEPRLVDG